MYVYELGHGSEFIKSKIILPTPQTSLAVETGCRGTLVVSSVVV
jgi:hypothetical protein